MTAVYADVRPEKTAAHVVGGPSAPSPASTSDSRVDVTDIADLTKRVAAIAQRNSDTTARIVDLGVLLSRLEGLDREEVAQMLAVKPRRLTAWVHQVETIPSTKGSKIAELLELVDEVHKIIERRGTARWFRLSIPELGDRTPMAAIAAGEMPKVEALVRSYLDPSYT